MTRVLVVDDKEENLYYLQALLGAHGWQVETARHGAEALVKARQAPPDLVVSDLLMPVMDGYTLLRHWKADARLCRVPFVVYTATYTEPEDERLALNLGADAFILKPAEPDAFVARVREVLERSATAPQHSVGPPNPPNQPHDDEAMLLREYSSTLIRKLEEKSLQLEKSNRQLQRDIAARESVEVALRESEERFRQLAESIDDVFWLGDPQMDSLLYVSPAYEVVWGRPCVGLRAAPTSWISAIHPGDRARVEASLASSVGAYARGEWEESYRLVRPDGAVRWIRARAYPVRDLEGRIYRVAVVSRDVTEYRRLEEQFRQAQKLEAIGRLAGGVAHDFSNMLSVILSYTSMLLLDLRSDDPMRADMEEIHRAGMRATDLTRQLLTFSRQQALQPQVVELGRVVAGTQTMLRRLLGEDVELSLSVGDSRGKVHVDPSQIEQIVMNLAVNARDAMPTGGTLAIEVRDVEIDDDGTTAVPGLPSGGYVVLAVRDDGEGMDAATRERIFEPFFTTKESGRGTGLGLSTIFGIVSQSQGQIVVTSEPGAGSRFEVYLPRTDLAVAAPVVGAPAPATLRGSETILLVEDDDQVRATTREILRRQGYAVIEADEGNAALEAARGFTGEIHLLVTDVVMPHMSGRELAQRLVEARPGMAVLYVSGYSQSAIVQHGVDGTGAFLQKPITPDTLLRRVRELLEAR